MNKQVCFDDVIHIAPGEESDVGVGTMYPIGVPLHKLGYWLYVVKKWRVDVSFFASVSASGGEGTSAGADLSGSTADSVYEPAITMEEELLLHPNVLTNGGDESSEEQVGEIEGNHAGAIVYTTLQMDMLRPDGAPVLQVGELYYPRLLIVGLVQLNGSASNFTPDENPSLPAVIGSATAQQIMEWRSDVSGVEETFEVIMDGEIFACPYYIGELEQTLSGTGAHVDPSGLAVPSSCLITPMEFWPYDDGEGPLWHETTGQKLRPNQTNSGEV